MTANISRIRRTTDGNCAKLFQIFEGDVCKSLEKLHIVDGGTYLPYRPIMLANFGD